MSEEKKIIELKDEELEKVNGGGAENTLHAVYAGDVFLDSSGKWGFLILSNVTDNGNDPTVPVKKISLLDNDWTVTLTTDKRFDYIKNNFTYSPELSGTLDYLLY